MHLSYRGFAYAGQLSSRKTAKSMHGGNFRALGERETGEHLDQSVLTILLTRQRRRSLAAHAGRSPTCNGAGKAEDPGSVLLYAEDSTEAGAAFARYCWEI
jgi:hypothetical protein